MTVIDFASSPLADCLEDSLALSRLLMPLMLVSGVALELRRGRSLRRWWRMIGLRAVTVGCLLVGWGGRSVYGALLGPVLDFALGVDLVSRESWSHLTEVARAFAEAPDGRWPLESVAAATPLALQSLLLGMAALARLLASWLYLLGPVVLTLAIPGGAGRVSWWVRSLFSVLAWPILILLTVDLTAGVAGGLTPTSEATAESVALGVLLGGAALAVPMVGWAGATSVVEAGAVTWGAWAGLAASLVGQRPLRAPAVLGRRRPDEAAHRTPQRARRISWRPAHSMASAPLDGAELPRATPALPRVRQSIEPFEVRHEGPRLASRKELTPPAIPPVVPGEVRHGVRRGGAVVLLEVPTPQEGIDSPAPPYPALRSTVAPQRAGRSPLRPVGALAKDDDAERTCPLAKVEPVRKTAPVVTAPRADRAALPRPGATREREPSAGPRVSPAERRGHASLCRDS